MSRESDAYRTRGIIMIIVGALMLGCAIFLLIGLDGFFWYSSMLMVGAVACFAIGGGMVRKAMVLNRTQVGDTDTTQTDQARSGPAVISTTGVVGPQYGGPPYTSDYGNVPPPPSYDMYSSSGPPGAVGVINDGDFPPGLSPEGQQTQTGFTYSNSSPNSAGYGFGGQPPYGAPTYGEPPPYSSLSSQK